MPFLIPVVAAIAGAVTAVATFVTGAIAALGIAAGLTATTAFAIGSAITAIGGALLVTEAIHEVSSLLFPQHSKIGGNSVAFKADPVAGVPYIIGRAGVGGNIVFADTSNDGHNKWLHYFTVLSHGPVDAIEGFTANNIPVSFNPDGSIYQIGIVYRGDYNSSYQYNVNDGVTYLGSTYICVATTIGHDPSNTAYWAPAGPNPKPAWSGKMWQTQTRGLQPDNALTDISGAGAIPEWTSAHKLSGLCHTRWALQSDTTAFPTGTPKPLWIVRGPRVYDPRQDSTYPGGSGAQRSNDPTTWAWSQNPYVHALTWLLGQTNNGKRVIGLGAPIAAIDVAAFVAGANVADANGWTVGGQVFSTDSKWDVFTQLLASGGGFPTRKGAQISCITDTPRVSIATLTGADFVGPVSVQAIASRKNRINQVVATYQSEVHQWSNVQADPINVPAYLSADGATRSKGVQMPLVQNIVQVGQLARYIIEDSREFGPVSGALKPQWLGLNPGDVITVNEPELGLNNQTLLILDRKVDPQTGCPTITCRSETGAKHAFALGQTANPPPAPALTGFDLVAAAPNSPPWAAVGATLTANGVSAPAIVVTGVVENPNASNVIIRTRLTAGPGPWTHYDSPPAAVATRVEITGVGSGEQRDIGISYLVRGIQGNELVIAGVTAGQAGGTGGGGTTAVTVPTPAVSWANQSASGAGRQTVTFPAQTFGGLTQPITLTLTFTGSGLFSYQKNGGAWTAFTSGATLSVAAGDTLAFQAYADSTTSGTLTVTDTTAATVLSTPTYGLTVTANSQTLSPAPAWADVSATSYGSQPAGGYTGAQTMQGINVAVTLKITWTGSLASMNYKLNGGSLTAITNGGTVSVSPGDTLNWRPVKSGTGTVTGVASVTNSSTGGSAVDSFNYALTVNSGPWP